MVEEEISTVPKISIIVPVYNVEKYLRRCIDSILAQTFTEFELILVDDGSPDGCPAICDEYAVQDDRIRVIHQTNSGVSVARNAGLDVVRGEWIGFVDSDDWIEPNMYEYLYSVAKKTNADAVVCGFFGQHYRRVRCMCGTEKALKYIFEKNGFGGFSFLRLVAAEKVQYIRFDVDISYLEDMAFFYEVFKRCEKVYWDNKPLYHYEYNQSSVSSAYGLTWQAKSALTLLDRLYQNETNKKMRKVLLHSRYHFLLSKLIQYIRRHDFDSAEYAYLYAEVKRNAIPIMFNVRHNAKRKIVTFLICFTPLLKPSCCEDRK